MSAKRRGPLYFGAVIILAAIVSGGAWWHYHHASSARVLSSSTPISSQPVAQQVAANGIQPVQPATGYLDITEWGVRLALDSTTASLYYYIDPNNPDVAYLSLRNIAAVAPNCAADKISLGAIARLTNSQQQSASKNPSSLSQPGTVQIGTYWYSFTKSQVACTDGSESMGTAVGNALPNYSGATLKNTFDTLTVATAAN